MIAVFQSPAEKLSQYVGRQEPPFPLVAVPPQRLYAAYGVEHSSGGLLAAWAFRSREIARAIFSHGFRPGSIEGGIHRIPADFLIAPDGRIRVAYYGRDIGDHVPIETIEAELENAGSFTAANESPRGEHRGSPGERDARSVDLDRE
jgi:thioredoxin-dependent peroxiredoxin